MLEQFRQFVNRLPSLLEGQLYARIYRVMSIPGQARSDRANRFSDILFKDFPLTLSPFLAAAIP